MEVTEAVNDVSANDPAKPKFKEPTAKNKQDLNMTSSITSVTSSLSSPVDSGVQCLDSESELTSVMSVSGMGCDMDTAVSIVSETRKNGSEVLKEVVSNSILDRSAKRDERRYDMPKSKSNITTKSDIDNQNVVQYNLNQISSSVPSYFDKFDDAFMKSQMQSNYTSFPPINSSDADEVFEMEHPIKQNTEPDLMNISLNSYELLDYTSQNTQIPAELDQMHVSMSEEVNENLRINLNIDNPPKIDENIPVIEPDVKPVEEQIVFRRQRKKKSKSDTPKKRVSFHEDILNSTKIDDVHINHGFITHEPVSLSFFERNFMKKPDVVKGRYSWAAEGDAPYYEKATPVREVRSDIYEHNTRFSSTSSSSTGSISSSIDEEDTSDENVKKEPTQKLPKSSCLKKTKHPKRMIKTNIVQEELNCAKKKSETILDTNIFGSLKNILNFSTSMPLAERGVPEGQEDVVCSLVHENRRRSCANLSFKGFESIPLDPEPKKVEPLAKTNLKLTQKEGFYPNYPNNQNLPSNIILCDSNVYEHRGISYSYEYDNFKKNFDQQNKPKSSTVYQMILKEFNFFRKKPKPESSEDFEIIPHHSQPAKEGVEFVDETTEVKAPPQPVNVKLDWSDDTTSEFSESVSSKHLSSPKRKINRNNHYSIQNSFKSLDSNEFETKSLPNLKTSNSKNSLINRFLKNVTVRKMLDVKTQSKQKNTRKYMGLYVKGVKAKVEKDELDWQIENELMLNSKAPRKDFEGLIDRKLLGQLRKEVLRNAQEKVLRTFLVRSAYTTSGASKPLNVIITTTTLYIVSLKPNNTYGSHFVLPYPDLNTILIGPSAQTVHFSNYDKDMQCIITTGCSVITNDLIVQLEVAMRRDIRRPELPAIKQLSMRDMANLRRAIFKQTTVAKDEDYMYYSIVNIQDFSLDAQEITPLGPSKEGPLMFKTQDAESRWETAYFILKAGVLYMLSSASHRVPMKVFPLINGSCQGARRVFSSRRPHTFQIIVEKRILYLAAPDEYVASDWLQQLVHAASGSYNNRDKQLTQSCSLLMTSEHILTVREAFSHTITSMLPPHSKHDPIRGPQVLSCACIGDLTSFRLPSAEQSWCILEFACREVHECSGDWILYFASNSELEHFISTLEMLWAYNNDQGESFPLSTLAETDPLSKKCVDVYTSLRNSWPANMVHLQFL